MGSHKHKKKYESDSSSSESEASSSSSDSRSKVKKRSKKSKQSSSEESDNEKTYKSKSRRSSPSDDSDTEKTKKKTKLTQETVDRSTDHKHKEREHRVEKHKEEKYEERYKDKYKSSDTDRFKNRGKSRDRDVDESRNKRDSRDREVEESRNRRDSNTRERYEDREKYEDRDRNKRQEYRRDDRRSFRYQGNSRDHRDNNSNYRGRDRGANRGRRNNNRYENRGRRSSSFDHANAKWGKNENEDTKSEKREPQEKEKPNFGLTGKLTEETNTFKGIVIKYSEPPEARKPRRRWRLYPFKGEKALQTLYIHRESAYLIGRERKVVDLPVDHPSCSKQHAALQYRLVPFTREDGSSGKRVRPYLIDLDSANGTFINNKKIESKKYVELFEKDVIKFGFSSREYVLLHENSKDEAMDDDVKQEEGEIPIKDEPE